MNKNFISSILRTPQLRRLAGGAGALLLAGGLLAGNCGCGRQKAAAGADAAVAAAKPVFAAPVAERQFEKSITAIGSLRAPNHALVAARVAGTLETLPVNEGDRVVAGETLLFQVDAANLDQAADIARQQLAVAAAAIREREANLEMVTADFNLAKTDYERHTRLYREDKAVTLAAFEAQESRFQKTAAAVKHAQALLALAVEQEKQAAAQLAIAGKNLADASVRAPLSGVVTKRFREPGERVAVGDAVFRIEDTAVLEGVFFLPELYYSEVIVGETRLRLRLDGREVGEYAVSYKGAAVSLDLRTFEARCVLPATAAAGLAPGRMAEGVFVLMRRTGPGVPSAALVERDGRPAVFLLDNGKARLTAVKPGLASGGFTEILEPLLPAGASLVSDGQHFLNDGDAVEVMEQKK